MSTWVEAPPPSKLGCFARGCLILLGFGIVLTVAGVIGFYWGSKHYSALVQGTYWLTTKTHTIAQKPAAMPQYQTSEVRITAVRERWQDFEAATRAGQPAEIDLTADEINDFIASSPQLRGKAFVSIVGTQLQIKASLPLGDITGMRGYYFNGDIGIQLEHPDSFAAPRLADITVNNQSLPANVLSWKYHAEQLKDYLSEITEPWSSSTVEIRDDKVILRSRE